MKQTTFSLLWKDWRKHKMGSVAVVALTGLFASVLLLLQIWFLQNGFDPSYQMYLSASTMPLLLGICFGGIALLFATLLLPKEKFPFGEVSLRTHASVRAMHWACALGCLYVAVGIFGNGSELFASPLLCLLTQLMCLGSAVYFCLEGSRREVPLPVRVISGFCVIFLTALRVFSLYFDQSRPVSAPMKIWELLGMLSVCLYFLCELRQWLQIPLPRVKQILFGVSVITLGASGVAQLIWGLANGQTQGLWFAFAVLETLLFCRLLMETLFALLPRAWDEVLNYLVFGVLTTVLNLITYVLLTKAGNVHFLVANVVAWIVGVIFAYVVNKFSVFEAKEISFRRIAIEFGLFTSARVLSLGAEELILWVGVSLLSGSDLVFKIIAAVVVIIMNYIASKFFIFRKTSGSADGEATYKSAEEEKNEA